MADHVSESSQFVDVGSWLTTLNQFATDTNADADALAEKLAKFTGIVYSPTTSFTKYIPNVTINEPDRPTVPTLSFITKTPPSALQIDVPSVNLDLGLIPTFDVEAPSINIPENPERFSETVPTKDFVLDLDKTFPDAPDTTLPTVPTFIDLDIPSPLEISIPLFVGDLPDSALIAVPDNTFIFLEDPYSSSLLDEIKTELSSRLSNSTGLNPVVEQAIWDRARDRESTALLQAERTLLIERSESGFSRPTGAALAALEQVVQESQGKLIEVSREIMIKQAELEQENFKFSMQQAISLEDTLMREWNNFQQRSFEVARYTQEVAIEIYKARVSQYNIELEAYKASAVVFEAKIRAELSKVEIFKAEIDAQKLISDINEQAVDIYVAQISAIETSVEIYKTTVQAVAEELRAEALKIEVYKSDVQAYTALVAAKAEEYRGFSEEVKAELIKSEVFDSQVKSFVSRIQAYSTTKDLEIKQADLKIDVEKLKLDKYGLDLDSYIKQIQSDQLIAQTSVDLYKGELQAYLADVSYNISISDLDLKNSEAIIDQNKFELDSAIERIKIRANLIDAENKNRLQGMISAGSIYAQLGSSSLNAINVSASFQDSIGARINDNFNHSIEGG